MMTGEPLFPGKNVAHQLDLITDMLGTPSSETIARIRNEKARRYLSNMKKKPSIPFSEKFPNLDSSALRLLEHLLAFDPKDRISAEEALADPYFSGLADIENEPSMRPISKMVFEFERRKLTKDDVRELIYREILEYHPQMLKEYLQGKEQIHFMYPSGIDQFKEQFAQLEDSPGKACKSTPLHRKHASVPRERVCNSLEETDEQSSDSGRATSSSGSSRITPRSRPRSERNEGQESAVRNVYTASKDSGGTSCKAHLLRSASIGAPKCASSMHTPKFEAESPFKSKGELVKGF